MSANRHRTPQLRRKKTGGYFIRWGGKDRYLGVDRAEAQRRYHRELITWSEWREARDQLGRLPPIRSPILTVDDLCEQFLDAKAAQRGPQLRAYYTHELRLFRATYGARLASSLRPLDLQAFQTWLVSRDKYKPKTINHQTVAVKAVLNWAADVELLPPMRLRGIKALPVGESASKAMTLAETWYIVANALRHRETSIAAWLAVNYLTLARPVEVCRVVNRQGEWEEPGIFRLGRSKVEAKTGIAKRLVFSTEALEWLALCEPTWTRSSSYIHAVGAFCRAPGRLRHTAATHLIHVYGQSRQDVEVLLGHARGVRRQSTIYAKQHWQAHRRTASLLTLRA